MKGWYGGHPGAAVDRVEDGCNGCNGCNGRNRCSGHLSAAIERVVDGVRVEVARRARLADEEALRAQELPRHTLQRSNRKCDARDRGCSTLRTVHTLQRRRA